MVSARLSRNGTESAVQVTLRSIAS